MWCSFTSLLTRQTKRCYQKASIKQSLRHTQPHTLLLFSQPLKGLSRRAMTLQQPEASPCPQCARPAALWAACPTGQRWWRGLTHAWVACQETAGGTQRCWGAGHRASWRLWEAYSGVLWWAVSFGAKSHGVGGQTDGLHLEEAEATWGRVTEANTKHV